MTMPATNSLDSGGRSINAACTHGAVVIPRYSPSHSRECGRRHKFAPVGKFGPGDSRTRDLGHLLPTGFVFSLAFIFGPHSWGPFFIPRVAP